jgi:CheY-like chemotaxis protein
MFECRLLLVEFSAAGAVPFSWLETNMPELRVDKASLTRAISRADDHAYDMIFIDIPADITPLEWSLIEDLVHRQQARDPVPVVVPVVPSGTVLHSMRRGLAEVSPVYLTHPIDLRQLQQVIQSFANVQA